MLRESRPTVTKGEVRNPIVTRVSEIIEAIQLPCAEANPGVDKDGGYSQNASLCIVFGGFPLILLLYGSCR